MKYQGAFSRIVGFAGKRFLFSPPPPPPPSIFFAPLQLSLYTSTGNACYAGYHYGRREGERRKGGRWRGEKIRLPDIIVLLGNSVRCQTELLIGAA